MRAKCIACQTNQTGDALVEILCTRGENMVHTLNIRETDATEWNSL